MQDAEQLGSRLDRLPGCWPVWRPVVLVSLAAIFELYDLNQTAYVSPALVRVGIFHARHGLFGLPDQASFAAATFLGLFIGAIGLASVADRLGRRAVFVYALLGYSAATLLQAVQHTAVGIDLMRCLAGVGLGVELVTIDTYLAELTPAPLRGRAFGFNHAVFYLGVPILALLSWWLMPRSPGGIDGWRIVVLIGSAGALLAWWLRRKLPESPRWLAQHGRSAEAERIVAVLEQQVRESTGRELPPPQAVPPPAPHAAQLREIWRAPYGQRTVMLVIFNFFQTIGYFGFSNWLPTLLGAQGFDFTHSLRYSFCIAAASPLSALLWAYTVAERVERKWLIVGSGLGMALLGPLFALAREPVLLVTIGVGITACQTLLSLAYHAYQAELYPTQVRARAVGFVYSFSRLSTALTSYLVAWFLTLWGPHGVFGLISFAMMMVVLSIGLLGPRTRGRALEQISR